MGRPRKKLTLKQRAALKATWKKTIIKKWGTYQKYLDAMVEHGREGGKKTAKDGVTKGFAAQPFEVVSAWGREGGSKSRKKLK